MTYAGFALYRYAPDRGPLPTGQGLGRAWYVISPAGRIVTRAVDDRVTGHDDTGTTTDDSGGATPSPGYGSGGHGHKGSYG